MKKILFTFATISMSIFATGAQAEEVEVLKISLGDGTTQTIKVSDIEEMSFATEEVKEPSVTDGFIGQFAGTNSVVVGGQFTYTAEITYDIVAGAENCITINVPEYKLSNTVMGDLTLGAYKIEDIAYDEAKGVFFKSYGGGDLTQHFKAEKDGTVSMDSDYKFNDGSEISIEKTATGIKVINSFKLGAMPFPIIATFESETGE